MYVLDSRLSAHPVSLTNMIDPSEIRGMRLGRCLQICVTGRWSKQATQCADDGGLGVQSGEILQILAWTRAALPEGASLVDATERWYPSGHLGNKLSAVISRSGCHCKSNAIVQFSWHLGVLVMSLFGTPVLSRLPRNEGLHEPMKAGSPTVEST